MVMSLSINANHTVIVSALESSPAETALINAQRHNSNIIAVVDGNIGAGKTTLLQHLRKLQHVGNRKVVVIEEPVEVWKQTKDENGTPIFDLFYENKKQHAFPFQMHTLISRWKVLKRAMEENTDAIIVTERSVYTDRDVFAKMQFDSGNITLVNYTVYLDLFESFESFTKDYPTVKHIYISANPQVCHERIKRRARDGESDIQLDYVESCHKYHENMLKDREKLVLDGNLDIVENESQLEIWTNSIVEFILHVVATKYFSD